MDSAKNVRWIIPFKKFGMIRVELERTERRDYNLAKFDTLAIFKTCIGLNGVPVFNNGRCNYKTL